MTTVNARVVAQPARPRPARSVFHLTAALLMAMAIAAGFVYEAPSYFFQTGLRRPAILYIHAAVFAGWVMLYVTQVALAYYSKVRWHRTFGTLGIGFAVLMPPLGVMTELTMLRFNLASTHSADIWKDVGQISVALGDLLVFTICAWAGLALRFWPAYHRRLMYLSTASLADNGIGRLPIPGASTWFYLGNFLLYLAAIIHDRKTNGDVHLVYRFFVPAVAAIELFALWLWLAHPAWWVAWVEKLFNLA